MYVFSVLTLGVRPLAPICSVSVMKLYRDISGSPPTETRNPIAMSRLARQSDTSTMIRASALICFFKAGLNGLCIKGVKTYMAQAHETGTSASTFIVLKTR